MADPTQIPDPLAAPDVPAVPPVDPAPVDPVPEPAAPAATAPAAAAPAAPAAPAPRAAITKADRERLANLGSARSTKALQEKLRALGYDSLEEMADKAGQAEADRIAGLTESDQLKEQVTRLTKDNASLKRQNGQLREQLQQAKRQATRANTKREVSEALAEAGVPAERRGQMISLYQGHLADTREDATKRLRPAAYLAEIKGKDPAFDALYFAAPVAPDPEPADTAPGDGTPDPAEAAPETGQKTVDDLSDAEFKKRTREKYDFTPGAQPFG